MALGVALGGHFPFVVFEINYNMRGISHTHAILLGTFFRRVAMKYRCSVCQQLKGKEDFPKDLSKKLRGGIAYTCRRCKTAASRDYQREYQREYRKTHNTHGNRTYVRAVAREARMAHREANPEIKKKQVQSPEYAKEYHLRRTYGISREILEEILAQQEVKCAICQNELTIGGRLPTSMVVDHCHSTEKVRGLLCRSCNGGLGFFKDSTLNLARARQYLKNAIDFKK